MEIKKNINKIHSELQNEFSDVSILERSEKKFGNHFEIKINESQLQLKVIIGNKNLESDTFNWSYYSNPENENSIVERTSSVQNFANDIKDIFEKKRFDSDYLKNKI